MVMLGTLLRLFVIVLYSISDIDSICDRISDIDGICDCISDIDDICDSISDIDSICDCNNYDRSNFKYTYQNMISF